LSPNTRQVLTPASNVDRVDDGPNGILSVVARLRSPSGS